MKSCVRWLLWVLPLLLLVPCEGALTSQQKKYGKALDALIVRADKGDAAANFELGRGYLDRPANWGWRGLTKEAAIAKGLEHFKKAAALNHLDSLIRLGKTYMEGNRELGVAQNRLEGERYFRQALALGSDLAQDYLVTSLYGVDDQEILRRNLTEWLLPLVEKENPAAMASYARLLYGQLRPAQPEKALELYKLAAAKGSIDAKQFLERREQDRKNTEMQAARAAQLAAAKEAKRLATEQEFQKLVAGVKADLTQALDLNYTMVLDHFTDAQRIEAAGLLEQLAATGNLRAQEVAARTFDDPRKPFLRNQEKAFHWELEVAKQKDTLAMFQVGLRYAAGNGVAKNEAEAIAWFRRSAEEGMKPLAEWQIQRLESHYPTEGAAAALQAGNAARAAGRDQEAVERYTYAANANMPEAMALLARHYLEGRGVPKDIEKADLWHRMTLNLKPQGDLYAYAGQTGEMLRKARNEAPIGIGFDGKAITSVTTVQEVADQRAAAAQQQAAAQATAVQLPTRSIGQRVGDGIVYWVDGSGQHGLILALTEIASGKPSALGLRPTTFDPQTGLTTWYLPTLDEWKLVRSERRRVEQALEREKGMALAKNGYYWTDTGILYSGGARGDRVSGNWCYEPINGGEREQDPYNTLAAVRGIRQF